MLFCDLLLCSLNIVRVKIDIAVLFNSDKVEGFLRFSSQNTPKPFPSHHQIKHLQILRLRRVETQPDQHRYRYLPVRRKTLRAHNIFLNRVQTCVYLLWIKLLYDLVVEET